VSYECSNPVIEIPEGLDVSTVYSKIRIADTDVYLFLTSTENISTTAYELPVPFATDVNAIILTLYLGEDELAEFKIDKQETLSFERLEKVIRASSYYTMIEIDHNSISAINDHVANCGNTLNFWISYIEQSLENKDSLITGITGIFINLKIELPVPIKISHTMNDFREILFEQYLENVSNLREQGHTQFICFEDFYSLFRNSFEESSCNISSEHPFMLSMTTKGMTIYEHPLFSLSAQEPIKYQKWIICQGCWKST
jgi:hypothetical protein